MFQRGPFFFLTRRVSDLAGSEKKGRCEAHVSADKRHGPQRHSRE
jgi:hypothetical protein